jgi:tRNA(Ile)-lysidine synthase
MPSASHPLLSALATALARDPATGPTLVAVSGGPDSLALLHGFHALRPADARAAHLNHGLRGAESDGDQAFVEGFCRQHGIPLHLEALPVRATADAAGANLEATARQLRYAALGRLARGHGIPLVATGHTADDQAETVLHHLIRGTGLRGLRGIAPLLPLAEGVTLIRPLLAVPRAEVLAYLQAHGLTARFDSSNLDETLTRNRIRRQLLPLLKTAFNPAVVTNLGRLARQATELHDDLQARARQALAAAERPGSGGVVTLAAAALAPAPRPVLREVLRVVWEREGWPMGRMTLDHWERVADLIHPGGPPQDLPGGVRARSRRGLVYLAQTSGGVYPRREGAPPG